MRIQQTTFGTVSIFLVRVLSLLAVHVRVHEKKHQNTGFTSRLLLPSEDFTLPERFDLGLVRFSPQPIFLSFVYSFSSQNSRDFSSTIQVNLVDRPSTSQADLSAQEMASSVPALLTKIARFRPRVVCFIGKGIWLHVERALNLLKGGATGNQYTGSPLGAHTQGNVVHQSAKTPVTPKDGRSAYFLLDSDTPRVSIQRPLKAEPERCLDFSEAVKPEETQSDVSYEKLEDTAEATALLSFLSRSTMRRRTGMSSSKKGETPPAQAFAYGLQPFKALHDTVPNVRISFYALQRKYLFDNIAALSLRASQKRSSACSRVHLAVS